MSTHVLSKTEQQARRLGTPVIESVHEVWLAGLGAFSVARRETARVARQGNKLFERLVAEGGKFEGKLRKAAASGASEVADRFETITKSMPKPTGLERLFRKGTVPTVYHLVPKDDEWVVRREGSDQDIGQHATKKAALTAARGVAQAHEPSRLVVHRSDGTIQTSYGYGEDA
jgi:hypothetical protein